MQEQDRVIDAAETAGFPRNDATRAKLIDLYAQHGLQKMLDGIAICVDNSVCKLNYLTAVLNGEPKKPKPANQPTKTVTAQQYTQRDYSTVDAEAFQNMLRLGRLAR